MTYSSEEELVEKQYGNNKEGDKQVFRYNGHVLEQWTAPSSGIDEPALRQQLSWKNDDRLITIRSCNYCAQEAIEFIKLSNCRNPVLAINCQRFENIKLRDDGNWIITSYNDKLRKLVNDTARHFLRGRVNATTPVCGPDGSFYWKPIGAHNIPPVLSVYLGGRRYERDSYVSIGPSGHWTYIGNDCLWEIPAAMADVIVGTMSRQKSQVVVPRIVAFGTDDSKSRKSSSKFASVSWIVVWPDGTLDYSKRKTHIDTSFNSCTISYDHCKVDPVHKPVRPPRPLLSLLKRLSKRERQEIRDISLGPAGEWVLVRGDNSIAADGLPPALIEMLGRIKKTGGRVRTVKFGTDAVGNLIWLVRCYIPTTTDILQKI